MKKVAAILAAVLMMVLATMPVFAEEDSTWLSSPQGSKKDFNIVVVPTEGGGADYSYTTDIVDGKQQVHIVPKPNDGYEFNHWDISGDYTIVSQDDKTGAIDVIVSEDTVITPVYSKVGTNEIATATAYVDNSSKSPKTGNTDVMMVTMVSLAALLAIGITVGASVLVVKKK